ncbi:hypothetical protein AB0P36_15155 [Streptomyces flavidovirens]|uniref:hypothetical protein n=1 Tax=Streptomyces flavidovirens TaxID=67298 RepID=UPI003439DBD3
MPATWGARSLGVRSPAVSRRAGRIRPAAPDSTAVELAELRARTRSPLVAVVERRDGDPGRLLGVVTATRLLEHLLQTA